MKKIIVFLFCVICWKNAMAYKYTEDFQDGFYWSALPVDFLVIDSDANRLALISGLAQEAVQEWETEIFDNLWELSSQQVSSSSRNIIRWSTNFAQETGLAAATTLAVAIRYSRGPYIARSEIIINGGHQLNQFPQQLRTVLIHELGHTLGLDHSEVWDAVMAPTLQVNYQGLHWDDIQGMNDVVSTTRFRQATGYVSPLSRSKESGGSNALSCATVDMSGGGPGPGGPLSLILGFGLMTLLMAVPRKAFKSNR